VVPVLYDGNPALPAAGTCCGPMVRGDGRNLFGAARPTIKIPKRRESSQGSFDLSKLQVHHGWRVAVTAEVHGVGDYRNVKSMLGTRAAAARICARIVAVWCCSRSTRAKSRAASWG